MKALFGGERRSLAAVSLALLGAVPLAGGVAEAQNKPGEGREAFAEVDPYTEGEPEALAEAGYLGFGPLHFVASQGSAQVSELLGGVPLIWVETAHFRLGSSLDAYDLSRNAEEKKKVRAELTRLAERLPGVKTRTRTLDPWLRLHLFAQRAEEAYRDFHEVFGLEGDVPPGYDPRTSAARPGQGPFLGLRDKFTVLLTQKESSMARFTATLCGMRAPASLRFHFPKDDSAFFGLSQESLGELKRVDTHMHYALVMGLAQNFVEAYRGYEYQGAVFWHLGVGRWFARRVDPTVLLYVDPPATAFYRDEKEARWPAKVRARVEVEHYPDARALLAWMDGNAMSFADHMMLWSRIDFLMAQGEEARRALLERLSKVLVYDPSPEVRRDRFGAHLEAVLGEVLGLTLGDFDRRWAEWVLDEYPRR